MTEYTGALEKLVIQPAKSRTIVIGTEMMLGGPSAELPTNSVLFKDRRVARATRVGRVLRRHSLDELAGWQISGRSDLSWEQSLRLDLWDVDDKSPVLDLQILVGTFRAVLGGCGAY